MLVAQPPPSADDRLLVFAPHPDDETLAAGELIQSALAAGAAVRVVFVTDGDNNPWPQRWLERRWRIGPTERARWGERRRREAGEALALLGVDHKDAARFLGWPDQGLTDSLMRDDRAVDRLVKEISGFSPTHLALPMLADGHPDHSALRVMLELALLRSGSACVRLGYIVHGATSDALERRVAADAARQQRKQEAMQAYASQMSLSRHRLLALAARSEQFQVGQASPVPDSLPAISIPLRAGWAARRRHELLLVVATTSDTLRWRAPLPAKTISLANAAGQTLTIESTPDALNVTLPPLAAPLVAVFAKVHRTGPRLVIFDRQPWYEAADLLSVSDRQAAAEPV
jgi:LmbE family N-acetylglucosaminyl deacetylase